MWHFLNGIAFISSDFGNRIFYFAWLWYAHMRHYYSVLFTYVTVFSAILSHQYRKIYLLSSAMYWIRKKLLRFWALFSSYRRSILGHYIPHVPVPLFNVYPASKYALTALSQTLRQELAYNKDNNIKLTVIHTFREFAAFLLYIICESSDCEPRAGRYRSAKRSWVHCVCRTAEASDRRRDPSNSLRAKHRRTCSGSSLRTFFGKLSFCS